MQILCLGDLWFFQPIVNGYSEVRQSIGKVVRQGICINKAISADIHHDPYNDDDDDADIYPGSPLALAGFIRALQINISRPIIA